VAGQDGSLFDFTRMAISEKRDRNAHPAQIQACRGSLW
jgi:hypothetical protein